LDTTRAGEAFFPEARRLSEEVEAAEAVARASERTLEGGASVPALITALGQDRRIAPVRYVWLTFK
jgi:DNA-binding transcriptional LysR family regulator